MAKVEVLWSGGATLGEGPVWDAGRARLWFTDIKAPRVHCFDPASGAMQCWNAPAQVGWVAPAQDGALIAGLQTGLHRFYPDSGEFTLLAAVEPRLPSNRLNDATVASDGAIWFGSMDDEENAKSGRFYRWDGQIAQPLPIEPVCITNGPALSPDQSRLYHVDTQGGVVQVSTLDTKGMVVATREFARIDPADGHPDGCSVDAVGNIWLGLWGGWRARLYSPTGEILNEVRLPVSNITKVALGGPDLSTAFVTTARAGLSPEQLAEQPLAGALFSFEVEIPGIASPLARIG